MSGILQKLKEIDSAMKLRIITELITSFPLLYTDGRLNKRRPVAALRRGQRPFFNSLDDVDR